MRPLKGAQPDSATESQGVPHLLPRAAFLCQPHSITGYRVKRPVGPRLSEGGTSLAEIGICPKLAQPQRNPAGAQGIGAAQALEIGGEHGDVGQPRQGIAKEIEC